MVHSFVLFFFVFISCRHKKFFSIDTNIPFLNAFFFSFPIDTKIPVNIKSSGYKTGDQASICINGKEYSLNKPGINIVVMDLLTFQVTERASFDTGHDKEASEQLIECIDMIPVGSLVFMAVRGEANYFLSGEYRGLKEILFHVI